MATLEGPLYVVRMQELQTGQLVYENSPINVGRVTERFKQLANKRSSQPGLYLLTGAKIAKKTWREQYTDNEYFKYTFDILPVHITLGDPVEC